MASEKLKYKLATIPFGILALAGLGEVLFPDVPIKMLSHLGYPSYVVYILGSAKFLGGVAIAFGNKHPTVKEWAYAGFAFDLIGATISHIVMADYTQAVTTSILTGFVFYSRMIWAKHTP
ncbi:hypothetical protein BH10CYA1_BH10CYA1_24560 [soil metagenome]